MKSEKDAHIVLRSLSVDKEPKGAKVKKMWSVEGNSLVVQASCDSVALLRTVTSSFFDFLTPVLEALGEFSLGD